MRKYYVDKKEYNSITTVANEISPFLEFDSYNKKVIYSASNKILSNIDNFVNDKNVIDTISNNIVMEYLTSKKNAIEIGTKVHSYINKAIQDNEITVIKKCNDKMILNGLNAWNDFVEKSKIKIFESELMIHNNHYAGTLDLFAKIKRQYYIIDIKTTAFDLEKNQFYFSMNHLLQISMYYDCIKYLVDSCIQDYKIKQVNDSNAIDMHVKIDDKSFGAMKQFIKKPKVALLYLCRKSGEYRFIEFDITDIKNSLAYIKEYLKYKKAISKINIKKSKYIKL